MWDMIMHNGALDKSLTTNPLPSWVPNTIVTYSDKLVKFGYK